MNVDEYINLTPEKTQAVCDNWRLKHGLQIVGNVDCTEECSAEKTCPLNPANVEGLSWIQDDFVVN